MIGESSDSNCSVNIGIRMISSLCLVIRCLTLEVQNGHLKQPFSLTYVFRVIETLFRKFVIVPQLQYERPQSKSVGTKISGKNR